MIEVIQQTSTTLNIDHAGSMVSIEKIVHATWDS